MTLGQFIGKLLYGAVFIPVFCMLVVAVIGLPVMLAAITNNPVFLLLYLIAIGLFIAFNQE